MSIVAACFADAVCIASLLFIARASAFADGDINGLEVTELDNPKLSSCGTYVAANAVETPNAEIARVAAIVEKRIVDFIDNSRRINEWHLLVVMLVTNLT